MQNGNFMNEIDLWVYESVCESTLILFSIFLHWLPSHFFDLFFIYFFLFRCCKATFYVEKKSPVWQATNTHNGHAYSQINNTRKVRFAEKTAWNLKLIDCDSSSVAFVIWQLINRRMNMTVQMLERRIKSTINGKKRNETNMHTSAKLHWKISAETTYCVRASVCFLWFFLFPLSPYACDRVLATLMQWLYFIR